jgi:glucose-1-phosphate cytidylyltransferase
VRDTVRGEDLFLANYSDGLSNVNLNEMISVFQASDAIASFVAVHPPITYHLAQLSDAGRVRTFLTSETSDLWINGGFFIMKPAVFDYMAEGEELVAEPFQRLLQEDKLMAFRHTGFWRSMDTLRDRQVLEDMFERGDMPWRVLNDASLQPSLGARA